MRTMTASLGGFAVAGLTRARTTPRRGRAVGALRGGNGAGSRAGRRFSEQLGRGADSLVELIGDVDRAVEPLPPPSAEQAAVVASVSERVNVACEAVAGSGKTTTVLHCAREVPHLRFLVLTYNARLKLQTRQRAKELGLSNLEVHSFHAMAARYYAPDCRNDETLRRLVDADAPPHSRAVFDCLVIDEAQDLTPLLHRFVLKILRDRSRALSDARDPDLDPDGRGSAPPSMLVLGDSRQSIYQFRDADPRFLTFADRGVYRISSDASDAEPPAWRHRTLRTSFRATPNIASFVNDAMLGFPCLRAEPKPSLGDPAGPPVTYLVGNAFAVASQELVDEIEFLLEEGYAPDDIFVLTPSLKGAKLNSKTPLAQLENTLVMRLGVPVYVSLADEEELSDSLIRGKVCLTTFHASKGLERPVVIVFGFSENYFAYYARDAPRAVCPNPLYVAATRASERLYLVGEEEEGGKLPFLRVDPELHSRWGAPLPDWIRVRRCGKMRPPADVVPVPASRFAVTDLVKFLPERTMADVTASLRAETTNAPTRDAAIDGTVPSLAGRGLIESVSDITGLAVVAAHEQRHARGEGGGGSRGTALARRLASGLRKMEKQLEASAAQRRARKDADEVRTDVIVDDVEALRQMREALASEPSRVTDFLRLASWYEAMEGGYLFRPFQLSHFDWVPADAAATVAEVLEEHLPTHRGGADVRPVDVRYERRYDVSFRFGAPIVTILGAADVVTAAEPRGEIFEVKCVKKLLPEHLLQLALYQWLDAFGRVQTRVHDARARRRAGSGSGSGSGASGSGASGQPRPSRGVKGTGKDKREYTEEEATGPLELLDLYEKAGGDASKMLRRAVLLNARTGETIELRADMRTLTRAVLALVDHRLRSDATATDDEFLAAAEAAGAATHAPNAEGGGFVPTPAANADGAGDAARSKEKPQKRRVEGRGVVKRRLPKSETSDAEGTETESKAKATKAKATKATKAKAKTTTKAPPPPPPPMTTTSETRTKSSAGFVFVGGESREADSNRRVLVGGDAPRPRGRAPAGRPWWDTVAGEFVAEDAS